jgi:DNA-binding MarR family transcriptional regulator
MKVKRDLTLYRNCVCFNLRRATRILSQQYDFELRRHGLRSTQASVLHVLYARESWTMATLSELLGMDRTTLLRNLRPLERDGLLKNTGGGHGVQVSVSITDKGRKKVESLAPSWRLAQGKIIDTLGDERWSSLLDQLETATTTIKK